MTQESEIKRRDLSAETDKVKDNTRQVLPGKNDATPAESTVAVALGQTTDNSSAPPKILATGRGEFAEVILDIAFKNGVKVRQDSDLAEILAAVDIDSAIPVEAFIAVAEILRYVYASNNETPPDPREWQIDGDPT